MMQAGFGKLSVAAGSAAQKAAAMAQSGGQSASQALQEGQLGDKLAFASSKAAETAKSGWGSMKSMFGKAVAQIESCVAPYACPCCGVLYWVGRRA